MNPRTPRWVVSGEKVRRARLRRGLSLAVVGGQCGHQKTWLHKIETGERDVVLDDLLTLCRVLNATVVDLVANPRDAEILSGIMPRPATEGLVGPWTGAGNVATLQTLIGDVVDRRTFITVTGAAAVAPTLAWAREPVATDLGKAGGPALPEGAIEEVDQTTAQISQIGDKVGSSVLSWGVDHLARVRRLLVEHSRSEQEGRRLHASAGTLLNVCGYLSFDAGDHGQAQRYWDAALRAAHVAGDVAVAAYSLDLLTQQAIDLGNRQDALVHIQTARQRYSGASPRLRTLLFLQEARAKAAVRDEIGTRRAIDAGLSAHDSLSPSAGDPWWIHWVSTESAHMMVAKALQAMGDWDGALTHLELAERGRPASTRPGRRRVGQLFRLALVHGARPNPDVDHSVSMANQALDMLSGAVESPRALGYARDLVNHLAPHGRRPDVKQFTVRVRELTRAA